MDRLAVNKLIDYINASVMDADALANDHFSHAADAYNSGVGDAIEAIIDYLSDEYS